MCGVITVALLVMATLPVLHQKLGKPTGSPPSGRLCIYTVNNNIINYTILLFSPTDCSLCQYQTFISFFFCDCPQHPFASLHLPVTYIMHLSSAALLFAFAIGAIATPEAVEKRQGSVSELLDLSVSLPRTCVSLLTKLPELPSPE